MSLKIHTDVGDVSVVESRGDLPPHAETCVLDSSFVGLDSETTGLDWRTNRLGIVQVFVPETATAYIVHCNDQHPRHLIELIESNAVTKVFHYALFDLRFLCSTWEMEPRLIECTKVAAKLLTPSADKHSLFGLLRQYLGIEISKPRDVRVSDWSAQSLSDAQLEYAAGDVVYLPRLIASLRDELSDNQLEELAKKCFSFIPHQLKAELLGVKNLFGY